MISSLSSLGRLLSGSIAPNLLIYFFGRTTRLIVVIDLYNIRQTLEAYEGPITKKEGSI